MVESAANWSFVRRVLGEKSTAVSFFVGPRRAITVGLERPTRLDVGTAEGPLEVRVLGSAPVHVGQPLTVFEIDRDAPAFRPLRLSNAEAGKMWESVFFRPGRDTEGYEVRGHVVASMTDSTELAVDGKLDRDSIVVGAPVVVDGEVAGVIVGSLGRGRLDAAPSQLVSRLLREWLPGVGSRLEVRRLSQAAEQALALARAAEAIFGRALSPVEAVLLGVLIHAVGSTGERPNFSRNLYGYLTSSGTGDPLADLAQRKGLDAERLPRRPAPRGPVTDADHDGIVGRAYQLRTATRGDDWIAVRHLVGALIVDAPDVLLAAGADLDRLRQQFVADLAAHCPRDDLQAWRRELTRRPATASAPRRVQVRAGYRPDDLGDQDELGITDDVNMLCDVLAARDAEPPMSVGLFGDWGTGKSFFMRQMERRINVLMAAARRAEHEGRTSAYCSNIVQIRFNAWSYMDANLWANLALGIFEQLASPPAEPGADRGLEEERQEQERIAAERKQLLAELDTFRQLQAEVALDQEVARTQKAEVEAELAAIAAERAQQAARLAEVRARDFVAVLSEDEDLAKVRAGAAAALGLADVPVTELKSLAGELKTIGGRARAVWRLLRERRATGAVALAAVFCAAVLILGLVLMWGPGRVRLAGVASFLGSIVAGLTTFVGLVRPVLAKTAQGLDYLEQGVRRADERERQLLQEQTKEEVLLTERVRELEARQAALARREAETAAKVAESEKALQELEQGRRLYRFLEERSATVDYRQHLGIIALIRRDFERLTQLLRFDQPAGPALPRIDRIILYVDDLDRCPPERVVEVLQAVHLLLAFPIFVVVVGVDARWLLRSLANHYSEMLGPRRDGDGQDDPDLAGWESTPQNYLEKIFQIPFALSPMGSSGFSRLVRSLVGPARAAEAAAMDTDSSAPDQASHQVAGGTQPAFETPLESRQETATPAERVPVTPTPVAAAPPGVDPNPPSLEITPQELEFIGTLAPAIATPRLAKRLVNVYRLVRASQSQEDLVGYVEGHDYQAVLVLLATLVGFPAQAGRVYDALAAPGLSGSWSDFIAGLEPKPSGTSLANRFDSTIADEEAPHWARLHECLRDLHSTVQLPDDVSYYRRWVHRLARFSFETGRVRTPSPSPTSAPA